MATIPAISVVTGAAGGIGGGLVDVLLKRGDRVIAADINIEKLEQLRESLLESGGLTLSEHEDRFMTIELDVSSSTSWHTLRDRSRQRFGDPNVLVNNAGISPKHDGLKLQGVDIPIEEWDAVLAVNLTGAFLGMQTLVPAMQRDGYGRIVNISSAAARVGGRIAGMHYSASKTGMLGLTRGFAWELASSGITVNSVAPGRIDLGMAQQTTEEVNRRILGTIPVGRMGTPEDVGRMVAFLTATENGFITGATFDVNGGTHMQ